MGYDEVFGTLIFSVGSFSEVYTIPRPRTSQIPTDFFLFLFGIDVRGRYRDIVSFRPVLARGPLGNLSSETIKQEHIH